MRGSNSQDGSTPYCRCRVLYLGSSVPHASKEGLLGVQEPLRELYPEQGVHGARGIDSWLSVWSNGLLLENVDEQRKKVTRFFPIESLHYCAAVRYVKAGSSSDASATRFFPLDSPFARGGPASSQPPLFAAVLRRTTGIKVLECHAFICKRDMAANALVRCCFHAYADSRFAKGLEPPNGANSAGGQQNGTLATSSPIANGNGNVNGNGSLYHTLGGSSTTLAESHNGHTNGNGSPVSTKLDLGSNDDSGSLYNGDENHKVWARGRDDIDALYQEHGTMRSSKGSRPRQLIAPPPPPPPPPPSGPLMGPDEHQVNGMNGGSVNRKKPPKKPKKSKKIEEMQQQHLYSNGHGPMMHPHHHTLGHPVRPATAFHHHHHHHPHPGLPPPGSSRSVSGTLARPAPVLLVPAATLPRKMHQRGIRPIPAAAPIVPIYAPLPMYPTGYGTTGNRGRRQHHHLHQGPPDQALMDHGSNLGLVHSRRMAASHADLSAPPPGPMPGPDQQRSGADSPDNDSRFGTGIYRRKGHLNERAFSYSIRAEHRSRSHGSLASLGFAGTPMNGNGPPKEIDKKDREIAQMVSGLSIDDSASQAGMMIDPRGHPLKNGNAAHYHPQPLPRPRR